MAEEHNADRILLTFLLAGLSYHYIEAPALRLKKRFSRHQPWQVQKQAPALGKNSPLATESEDPSSTYILKSFSSDRSRQH